MTAKKDTTTQKKKAPTAAIFNYAAAGVLLGVVAYACIIEQPAPREAEAILSAQGFTDIETRYAGLGAKDTINCDHRSKMLYPTAFTAKQDGKEVTGTICFENHDKNEAYVAYNPGRFTGMVRTPR